MFLLTTALTNFFSSPYGMARVFFAVFHTTSFKRKFEGLPLDPRKVQWVFILHFQLAVATLGTEYQKKAGSRRLCIAFIVQLGLIEQ